MRIFLIISLLLPFYSIAQVLTVIDALSKEPVLFAQVVSNNPKAYGKTNSKGQIDISNYKGSLGIYVSAHTYSKVSYSYSELIGMNFIISMKSQTDLPIFTVEVNKWNQDKGNGQIKATSITADDIKLQNPQTAADLLGTTGEVMIQKSQLGGGSPIIRGFAANRLLISVDGVRMNNAIFRSGNLQNVISIDAFAVDNATVLFGPGSVIYGSDAIGGVMKFKTLEPQFSATDTLNVSGNLATRYSSASNEKTGHFDINFGWKKLSLLSSFSSYNYGDLKMGTNGPESFLRDTYVTRINNRDTAVTNDNPRVQNPTGFTQMNAMQKIRFKPNKIWDINYDFHYSETSEYSRYDRHLRTKGGLPRYGEWKYGPQKWVMNNLYVVNQGENWLWDLATFKVAHQRFEESRISRDFNDDIRGTQEEAVDALSLNFDFNNEIKKGRNLFYGIEVINNQVYSTAFDENINTKEISAAASRYPESDWSSYSAYASYDHTLTENLMIQAGTRYTVFHLNADFDTTFYPFDFTTASLTNDALTGNIGLTYQTKALTIGASSSTGFRAPNVDDIGKLFDSEPGAVVIPNPFLKAEYAFNQELSIEKIINKKVKVNTTLYYTYLKDAMVRRDDQLGGVDSIMYDGELSKVQSIQNAAFARVYGLQFSIEGKINKEFGFHSYLSLQNGIEELDDETTSPSRHAAPWFGSTHFDYTKNHLKLDLSVDYSGSKAFEDMPESEIAKDYLYDLDENGNPYAAGWAIVNLKAMYNVNSNVSLTGGIENILNKRYKTYSSGIVAPGRNLILALRVSF